MSDLEQAKPQNVPLGGQPERPVVDDHAQKKQKKADGDAVAVAIWLKIQEQTKAHAEALGAGVSDAEKELRSHLNWKTHFVIDKLALLSK